MLEIAGVELSPLLVDVDAADRCCRWTNDAPSRARLSMKQPVHWKMEDQSGGSNGPSSRGFASSALPGGDQTCTSTIIRLSRKMAYSASSWAKCIWIHSTAVLRLPRVHPKCCQILQCVAIRNGLLCFSVAAECRSWAEKTRGLESSCLLSCALLQPSN